MKTYSQQDISNWLKKRSQITAQMEYLQQETVRIEKIYQHKDDALQTYIADHITPKQTAINQIKAKIDILSLPDQIAKLSEKIADLSHSLSEHQRQLELANNTLRPINALIDASRSRLSTLEKDLAQKDELSRRIIALEERLTLESQQLRTLELNITTTSRELSTIQMTQQMTQNMDRAVRQLQRPSPHHSHVHGHDHGHRSTGSGFGGFVHSLVDIAQATQIAAKERQLADLREQKSILLRKTTHYQLKAAQQQRLEIDQRILEITSGYGDVASLRREIQLQEQERTHLAPEITILSRKIREGNQELTLQKEALVQYQAALEQARRLVLTEPTSANRDALDQALASIDTSLKVALSEQIRLEKEKGELTHDLSNCSIALQSANSALEEMAQDHFLVSFSENPVGLCDDLIARVQETVSNYENTHPYQQPLIVRQALTHIKDKLQEIPARWTNQDPHWRIGLLHGFLWDTISLLQANQVAHLPQNLRSAFGEAELNQQESIAVYQSVSNYLCPWPNPETVHQNEALAYSMAITTLRQMLDALPDHAPKEQRYFYKQGRTLLNTIEQEVLLARKKGDNTFDFKYYTKVLELTHLSLVSPENKENASALLALTNKDTTGQPSLVQKVKGLVALFLGAAIIAACVALPILTSGPWFIAASASGICSGLALLAIGQNLFASGCEKGLVKQGKVFENASKVSNITMWAKPMPLAYAIAVPPPPPPYPGEAPNYAPY